MSQQFKVRDRRNKGWFFMDNEYLNGYAREFGPVGTAIYVSLCRHADNDTQQCFPSMELMAEEIGSSRNTISKYIKLFEQKHLISIEREVNPTNQRRMNNVYTLLDKSEWDVHAQPLGMDSHAQPECIPMHKSHAQQLCNKDTMKNTNIKDTQKPLSLNNQNSSSKNQKGDSSNWLNKTDKSPAPLPEWLNLDAWGEWLKYNKKTLSPSTIRFQLKKLEKGKEHHVEMIERSIEHGWTSFFPLPEQGFVGGKSNIIKAKSGKYDEFDR